MSKQPLIMVGTDLSDPGNRAASYAADMATRLGARLMLVHVFNGFVTLPRELARPKTEEEIAARQGQHLVALRRLARGLARPGLHIDCLAVHGVAQDTLPKLAASRHAALLVMGAHGHALDNRYFLGSVADCVARSSPVPVLIVRGHTTPWTAEAAALPTTTSPALERS